MKRSLYLLIATVTLVLLGTAPAFAKWETVGSVDQAISVQKTQMCNFRIKWLTASMDTNAFHYLQHVDVSEQQDKTKGAVVSQTLLAIVDPALAEIFMATDQNGEAPRTTIRRLRQEIPGTQIYGAALLIRTLPTYAAFFSFKYIDGNGEDQYVFFNQLDPNRYTLERECPSTLRF